MSAQMIELYRIRMADLLRRARLAMEQLSDEEINWRPNELSNSIANLVIHLEGNLQHFVEARVGGAESRRNRDAEFNSREFMTRAQAVERLSAAVERADAVLARLAPERLGELSELNGRQVSHLELLLIITVHLGEHVGQILYIAKALRGEGYQVVLNPHRRA
ncbi:MAG: DinB family protein [Bacillota bacterium]